MKYLKHTLLLALVVLMASCGREHDAKQRIKQFLQDNLTEEFDIDEFSKMDSTVYVTPQMTARLHQDVDTMKFFRKQPKYSKQTEKLYFIHVKYKVKEEKRQQTFYLDDKLTGVVTFKNDI